MDRAYTPRGQLLSVDYSPAGAPGQSDVADFVYDAGGRETTRNLGNGLTTSRSYFADNQIQSIATPGVETLTYTYDANKNPTSETRSGVMAPYSWSTGPTGFDDEDRLVNWSRNNGDTQTWNLSPVHDWTSTTINGAIQSRTHGPAHEILTMVGDEVPSSPTTLFHDTKGNTTIDDRGCSMAWNFDNMLEAFSSNAVAGLRDASYTYDVIGRRISKAVAETGGVETTLVVQSGEQVTCEYSLGAATTDAERKYVYGRYIDEPVMFVDAAGATDLNYFFHSNRQYSTYGLTDHAGTVVQFCRYDPHGKHDFVSPTGISRDALTNGDHNVTFTGRVFDRESELHQFRARTYSAFTGRFSSRDPAGYADGFSLYPGYFSPAHTDPSGEGVFIVACVLVGAYFYCDTANAPSSTDGVVPSDPFSPVIIGGGVAGAGGAAARCLFLRCVPAYQKWQKVRELKAKLKALQQQIQKSENGIKTLEALNPAPEGPMSEAIALEKIAISGMKQRLDALLADLSCLL